MSIVRNVGLLFVLFAVVRHANADCPPIHTVLNGELISQPDPVCLARENPVVDTSVKCGLLNAPENGFFVGLCQPLVGFSCKFGCMSGFSLTHTNPLNCMSSGLWSSPPPACESVQPTNDCDIASVKALFKNGFINCNQNEKGQLVCRFFCFNGFVITGNPMLVCQANGKFNSMPPVCVSIDSPPNGMVEYNHSPLTSPNMVSPNLVYSKPFNYFVTANSVQCPQLNHLKSGSMNCDCSSSNYRTGCTCRFFCNEDYYLLGAPMLQCTKFGNWSAANPVCRRGSSCALPENLNKHVWLLHCNTKPNGKCYYRCKGTIYFIDSTGKITSNKLSSARNTAESEERSPAGNRRKKSYDFTLKSTECQSSGSWTNEFACDIEEELNSLNKLNVSSNGDRATATFIRNRRRRRRRRRRPLRFTPLVAPPNRPATRPTRPRRRRPARRPARRDRRGYVELD